MPSNSRSRAPVRASSHHRVGLSLHSWLSATLRYYRLQHLIFGAIVVLASAILTAALLAGNSLQQGLQQKLHQRLGRIRSALYLVEGGFPADLAERVPGSEAALLLRGELLDAGGEVWSDRAQIIGSTTMPPVAPGSSSSTALVNSRVSELNLGSSGALRFEKPSAYPLEMPLAERSAARSARRALQFEEYDVAGLDSLLPADFALSAGSTAPVNLFVSHSLLAAAAGMEGEANLLLSTLEPDALSRRVQESLTLADIGMQAHLPEFAAGFVQLTSHRIYLPTPLYREVVRSNPRTMGATFHLADDFTFGTNSTPYGFVAAMDQGLPGRANPLADNQVVINSWLAERLEIGAGESLKLRWRRFTASGELEPVEQEFEVAEIVPVSEAARSKVLIPEFPGLAGVDSCSAWDVGLPLDEELLEDEANELYWQEWRETPKLFMTLAAGREAFGTAFGEVMTLVTPASETEVVECIRGLEPAALGFAVMPLWQQGVAMAQGATDFRGLFVGLSFVLITAALLLAALSLELNLARRKGELQLLGAVGWSVRRIRWLRVAEWSVTIVVGGVVGALAGVAVARLLIWSLARFWRSAFAGAELEFHFSALMVAAGLGLSLVLLLPLVFKGSNVQGKHSDCFRKKLCIFRRRGAASRMQGSGAWVTRLMGLLIARHGPAGAALARAWLNLRQNTVVSLVLGLGVFMSVGILAMKSDPAAGSERSSSGSGGFAAIVSAVAPRERVEGVELARRVSGADEVVALREHGGDDAGCLNLNLPVAPRILGVSAEQMARLRAFEPEDGGGVWSLLQGELADGAIPVIAADQAMLRYSLKGVADPENGTIYTYTDRHGESVRLRLVGALPQRSTILHGALLMDEQVFTRLFADHGYRLWLCDYAPWLLRETAEPGGELRYPEPGVRIETVEERLRLLGSVQSTYLDIFLVLGGLGLMLGGGGVALVVARAVEERREELRLLSALGLSRLALFQLLGVEYLGVALSGLVPGLVSALALMLPTARQLGSEIPWGVLGVVVLLVSGVTVASIAGAALVATRPGVLLMPPGRE